MSTMLAWSVTAAQILLGLAMACAAFRILWGPRAQDRVVGLRHLYVNAMLLLLAFGIRSGSTLYFESGPDRCPARIREHGSACQIPASWRGDRMNEATDVPALATILTATLLIAGAAVTLIGSLRTTALARASIERVHAPTLGTTLGTVFIATASMIYFSALGTRPVLHELLMIVFVITTTPITLMVLVRAARFRDGPEANEAIRGEK